MNTIAINGAAGRMGIRLIHLITADPDLHLVGAIEVAHHPKIGMDAGLLAGLEPSQVPLSNIEGLASKPDSMIDFSHPHGTDEAIGYCLKSRTPLVVATTGLEADTIQNIQAAARQIPIVWAPNMSLAVNLTMKLVEIAAQALPADRTDVEIIERHHRFKADSPSGTALKFGEIIAKQMGQSEHRHGRVGMVGQRSSQEIGYHAVRVGDNPGEHTILFGMLGETVELRVAASNRDCYAAGAIAAAKFAMHQSPGLYSMVDVLGL